MRAGQQGVDGGLSTAPEAPASEPPPTPEKPGLMPSLGASLQPAAQPPVAVPLPASHSVLGAPSSGSGTADIPRFGARGKARELSAEVERLHHELQRLSRLELLSAAELEQRAADLKREIADQLARLAQERAQAHETLQSELAEAAQQRAQLHAQLQALQADVVATQDEAVLQEVGIYQYRHPLEDAVAYQAELSRLRDVIKVMTRKDGGAVLGRTDWTVNGSPSEGRAMVRDFSKLMLRAYNAEADNLVRGMKPYKLGSAIDRLTKVATTIARLGRTMQIQISQQYHDLRVHELELTADYLEVQAQQKEREREEKARLREERKAQQEMERERERLEKERQHHANALAALQAKGDAEGAARLEAQLAEIDQRIEDVDYRVANIRAGYVYVISNLGSFGESVVKIGMTRRLDPQDRVRELGDASVPFKYDTHALFFSQDAVGIESKLHERLTAQRVNQVNRRREFFYATPGQVKQLLSELTGELLEYTELPEALEFRQSRGADRTQSANGPPSSDADQPTGETVAINPPGSAAPA